ncbi:tRNA (uridine(34)/cytosine(34)/5-carboxymethylaminomethyluridine(34)-2'-O)-methyltransferase TrmL [Polycladomyces abyssicola]|uniref:Putative tRNA (cytidine(34)-2'-O)-methyltransferase n=1 Tax=Polycladomyces abyssicola TaxID=1125966 RepID=A0A8D5ZN56_9BACL|nr:tRNA (uridine(34)/cytosine(34)/5-carboxymethylaminomethyluridine(34)-2'-O)-methyltransferase TrmL [Polycladomyces abyssicola]BCU81003.1 tRNA (uridine(34)/cytosine(34)/5-carboxymethylaminomethyluridine(34)-2'-O)-methyltransferase TrmL [Polycladomyces abyssicola]
MSFHIVLVEPEIPYNTGNIARTCAVTGATLHLVGPLGFSIEDRYLKRAGLDYWDQVNVHLYDSFAELEAALPGRRFFCATTKADRSYTDFRYREGDVLIFGKETAGLPQEILEKYRDTNIRIPMRADTRSLNLSNAAAIVLYEALRQNGFPGLT